MKKKNYWQIRYKNLCLRMGKRVREDIAKSWCYATKEPNARARYLCLKDSLKTSVNDYCIEAFKI